jgi:DNA-binding CsgD family transcriptional regulator
MTSSRPVDVSTMKILETGKRVLTNRQFDALRYAAAGYSIPNMALAMGISETRARALQQRAFQKVEIALTEETDAAAA